MQHNPIYDDFDAWKQVKGYKTSGYFWDFLLLPFAPLIWLFNGGMCIGQTEDRPLVNAFLEESWNYYNVPESKRRYV
jgi:hypothetical protein